MAPNMQRPKPCEYCGTVMMLQPFFYERRRFCSKRCMGKANTTQLAQARERGRKPSTKRPKPCEKCGAIMMLEPARFGTQRFCSRKCKGGSDAATLAGIRFAGRNSGNFTTERVRGERNPKWVASLSFVCKHCDKPFERKPWQARHRDATNEFCSIACRGAWRTVHQVGPGSPLWVGGETTYRGANWREARLRAIVRDNGMCRHCRKVQGKSIPVHHIRPFREFASAVEANQIENLICLCQSCHMKMEPRKTGQSNARKRG